MDRNINNKRKILHQPSTTKEYFFSSRRGLNLKEGKVMPVAGKDGWRDGKGGGEGDFAIVKLFNLSLLKASSLNQVFLVVVQSFPYWDPTNGSNRFGS